MQQTLQKPRTADWRVLGVALVLAAIAAGLIVAYLASRDSSGTSVSPVADPVPVVVARQDIPAGVAVTASMVEVRHYPPDTLVANPVTAVADVIGQTARHPILRGEQLSMGRFVDTPSVNTLSFQIPKGLRGFTVPVDVTRSAAALLAPGDFVDVLAGSRAATLLQNVQVVSVQREFVDGIPYDESVRGDPPEKDNISYVTLAVTPAQAQVLWEAVQAGSITLSLRPFGDDEVVSLSPTTNPLSLQIPAGMRGFTVPVDVARSPAAVLVPGDFVDVYIGAGLDALLSNVQVLSVERNYVPADAPYDATVRGTASSDGDISYVTLAVTPEQARLLWVAFQQGADEKSITLALRGYGDNE
ncbi:MAG: hypothetical protein Kow0010_00730 [Dehalococcoidia bacterium]